MYVYCYIFIYYKKGRKKSGSNKRCCPCNWSSCHIYQDTFKEYDDIAYGVIQLQYKNNAKTQLLIPASEQFYRCNALV